MTWRTLLIAVALLVLPVSNTLALAQARMAAYRELPYGACRFAQEQFGFTPDAWQEETLIAFADPKIPRISLQACAGPGKTAVEAICGWYFLGTQCTPGEHPKGLCTSVTAQNLRDNLWAEFAKWQSRSEYLRTAFSWTSGRIFANDHPETWFLSPRAWPKTGSADDQGATLSGLHSQNVLCLIDESGSIPKTVLRAAEQALGNTTFGKILQGGNPMSVDGMLYEAAVRLRDQWYVIKINGDPDDPRRSPRIDIEWARQQIATYGRDNPWVMSYILGQFPPASLNALLGVEEVEAAMARHLNPEVYAWAQKRIGIDVARFGDDRTVLWARQGKNARVSTKNPIVMRHQRTNEIAARAALMFQRWGAEIVTIDDTGGWGQGTLDQLRVAGVNALGIQFGSKAVNPRYKNRRAEGWMQMAEAIKGGAALPKIDELIPELTTPTYFFNEGTFQIEDKDLIKKRLGRSPDLADALAMTYMLPEMPGQLVQGVTSTGGGRVAIDYDPYAGVNQ
jgi:phage terminase large subunit